MGNTFNNKIIQPCFHLCDDIIIKVNIEFTDLTGFTIDELLGKSRVEVGYMLKTDLDEIIDSKCSKYIFTKFLKAREVSISVSKANKINEKVYTFLKVSSTKLNVKLIFVEQTFIDKISGVAIYSVPNLILLKANQKYFDFLDFPFNREENSIGRPICEIVTGFAGSQSEVIFNTVIKTQRTSHVKELKFDKFARGLTYLDSKQTPIFEDGKMKYIFDTAIEVTEWVLKNKSLERQNKIILQQKEQLELQKKQLEQQKKQLEEQNTQLTSIIENLSEGVVVADSKGKFIMINSEAKKMGYESEEVISIGDIFKSNKYFDMKGNKIELENIPGMKALRGEIVKNHKMLITNSYNE